MTSSPRVDSAGLAPTLSLSFEQIKDIVGKSVPFNLHVGVELEEVGEGWCRAALDLTEEIKNHVGTMHGSALFQVAEFAAAISFVGAFAPYLGNVTFVARHATVDYPKPATGRVVATGKLIGTVDEILAAIRERGHTKAKAVGEARDADGVVVAVVEVALDVRPAAGGIAK
jgi:uncharacterized protein (TIGR00369 family)